MNRRKSQLFSLSILRWFYNSIAILLGIVPQSKRTRRISSKRCNKTFKKSTKRKSSQIVMHTDMNTRINDDICRSSEIAILNNNNNNNRIFDNLTHGETSVNKWFDSNQHRILCIQVENDKMLEYIQNLLIKHRSTLKNIRFINFQELIESIQLIIMNRTHEDVSTMTDINQNCCHDTFCINFMTQSENKRRLKALEFIRIFIEMNENDFCQHLIIKEHLCQQKTLAIYEIIKQFLNIVYEQK
ncbi:unnamed protein product [Adineta steineri]|uniref:Uncharacterized protein n=1 Tax=Adineta steineri TaxID=433720 RepID=A0A814AEG7_9BILA|nr:unnamed protein product [Adineta steineri]CAF0911567.1 unnamed protein product [Adineta steineri]CAF3613647.1 unnamed protein product [Adineta steineri]CAF3706465.1 unnamed protein product [Adineta steineri]